MNLSTHIEATKKEFADKFLKNVDAPLGPDLKITHGTLSFIANLESFLTSRLTLLAEDMKSVVPEEMPQ